MTLSAVASSNTVGLQAAAASTATREKRVVCVRVTNGLLVRTGGEASPQALL
jgi:hypothetical protein